MVDVGYETHNEILNLGSISLFVVYYFLKVIIYLLLKLYTYLSGKKTKIADTIGQQLFFGEILVLLIEAFFEFLISTLLQLRAPLKTESGEITSTWLGYLSLVLMLGFFLPSMLYILYQPLQRLKEEDYEK